MSCTGELEKYRGGGLVEHIQNLIRTAQEAQDNFEDIPDEPHTPISYQSSLYLCNEQAMSQCHGAHIRRRPKYVCDTSKTVKAINLQAGTDLRLLAKACEYLHTLVDRGRHETMQTSSGWLSKYIHQNNVF